jgi:sugar lactone lactonase YvrE
MPLVRLRAIGLAIDTNDNIYVGDFLDGRIQKFDSAGNFILRFGSLGSGDGQFGSPYYGGLSVDGVGNIYVADMSNHRIQKFDSAGNYIGKFGIRGTEPGEFNNPRAILVDTVDNTIYVADSSNMRVQHLTSVGAFLGYLGVFTPDSLHWLSPYGMAMNSQDHIHVVSYGLNRVNIFNSITGNYIGGFGSKGSGDGQFLTPYDVAIDSSGSILVADTGNNRIQRFNSDGTYLSQFGTFGIGDGQFKSPSGVATDQWGNIYVCDGLNNRIQKFDSAGNFISKWGTAGTGNGQFSLSAVSKVKVDSANNVWVTDWNNKRVQKFDSAGNFLLKFGSSGTGNGQFSPGGSPHDIAFDNQGNVLTADLYNNRVEKFDASGNFLMTFGTEGGAESQFNYLSALVFDSQGNLYTAEENNGRVQKFTFDRVAPTGSLVMNSGAGNANSRNVTLDLSATDNLSSVKDMMISESADFAGASWEIYAATKTFSLTASNGLKTVYVKYRDSFNTESVVYSDNIKLDTIKPTINITNLGLITDVPNKTQLTYYFTSQTPLIKGITEANAVVHFKYGAKDYTTAADGDGKYSLSIKNPALPRELVKLSYYAQDAAGNKSETRTLTLIIGEENLPNQEVKSADPGTTEPSVTPAEQTSQFFVYEVYDEYGNAIIDSTVSIEGQEYKTDTYGKVSLEAQLQANQKISLKVSGHEKDAYVQGQKLIIGKQVEDQSPAVVVPKSEGLSRWSCWLLILLFIAICVVVYRSLQQKNRKK